MGIRVSCPNCGKQLNVKSFLAGKRGVCPDCQARFDIPGGRNITIEVDEPAENIVAVQESSTPQGQPTPMPSVPVAQPVAPNQVLPSPGVVVAAAVEPVSPSPAVNPTIATPAFPGEFPALGPAAAAPQIAVPSAMPVTTPVQPAVAAVGQPPDPIAEAPQASWYVRLPAGGQFGPAMGEVMRQWIQQGRVTPDSLVWREGWADWQRADLAFPALAVPGMASAGQALPVAAAAPVMAAPHGQPMAMPTAVAVESPVGVDPMIASAFPAEPPRSSLSRTPYKRKSGSGRAIALTLLVLAVLVLAPLLGYVLMQQFK